MQPESSEVAARLELARAAARDAGKITLEFFQRTELSVELKADRSPVTEADRRAEESLRHQIGAAFNHDGILGEEFGEHSGTSGFRWILDPIDGTRSFVRGVPLYGTLVGIEHDRRVVAGVIELPALEQRVYAARGTGAWHQRGDEPAQRARVSGCERLAEAFLCITDPLGFERRDRTPAWNQLLGSVAHVRTWGDCYGYLLIAIGRADVMVDPDMHLWDNAPLQVVIEEAGGTFSDWQGGATIYGGDAVATNGRLHAEVLAITRGA